MTGKMRSLVAPLGVVCVDAFEVRKRHPARILRGWNSTLLPFCIRLSGKSSSWTPIMSRCAIPNISLRHRLSSIRAPCSGPIMVVRTGESHLAQLRPIDS